MTKFARTLLFGLIAFCSAFQLPTTKLVPHTWSKSHSLHLPSSVMEVGSGRQDSAAGATTLAVMGGGCFWCTEAIFLQAPGILSVTPGYAGGSTENPNYREVVSGKTGHAEVVCVEFDPLVVSLGQVYDLHLATHDPTQVNRQDSDVGTQYRSTILVSSSVEKGAAVAAIERAREKLQKNKGIFGIFGGGEVATLVEELVEFFPAEGYHRDYYAKHKMEPYCMKTITPKLRSWKVRSSLIELRESLEAQS